MWVRVNHQDTLCRKFYIGNFNYPRKIFIPSRDIPLSIVEIWHCIKNKKSRSRFYVTLQNTSHDNIMVSFLQFPMTYTTMKVVVGFRGQKRCERAGCWMPKWKSWEAKVEKKGSGNETIFGCVAFSLSRLFRDEYRQCSTTFSSRIFAKRKSRPFFRLLSCCVHPTPCSSLPLVFPPPFGHITSLSLVSRLRTQLKRGYRVSILRHRVPASSCSLPWDAEFRAWLPNRERFRELMRSKLNNNNQS